MIELGFKSRDDDINRDKIGNQIAYLLSVEKVPSSVSASDAIKANDRDCRYSKWRSGIEIATLKKIATN